MAGLLLLMTSTAAAILCFVYYDQPVFGAAAVVAALIGALILWRVRSKRVSQSKGGHHAGLEFIVAPRQLVVRTYNHAFACDVAERNKDHVHRVH